MTFPSSDELEEKEKVKNLGWANRTIEQRKEIFQEINEIIVNADIEKKPQIMSQINKVFEQTGKKKLEASVVIFGEWMLD